MGRNTYVEMECESGTRKQILLGRSAETSDRRRLVRLHVEDGE
jgi:hypothetical protein